MWLYTPRRNRKGFKGFRNALKTNGEVPVSTDPTHSLHRPQSNAEGQPKADRGWLGTADVGTRRRLQSIRAAYSGNSQPPF